MYLIDHEIKGKQGEVYLIEHELKGNRVRCV